MKYEIDSSCLSVVGKVRTNNEDNYYFNHKILNENHNESKLEIFTFANSDHVICSVFDGMGGQEKGERASYLGALTLQEYIKNHQNQNFNWSEYIEEANNRILSELSKTNNMGTTLAGVMFQENKISICNLGDSRVYGYKNHKITQLSTDHTEAKLMAKLNRDVKKAPLTQHLGIPQNIITLVPSINEVKYDEYDKILICSDGLTDLLSDEDLSNFLAKNNFAKDAVNNLVNEALNRGGVDNTTVMVFNIKKKQKISLFIPFAIGICALLTTISAFLIINFQSFKIINDEYSGPLTVGSSFEFKYKGHVTLEYDKEFIDYKDNRVIALKEGTTTIRIKKNSRGQTQTLYEKNIRILKNTTN